MCYKCKQEKGTLFHCMWECTKVNCFWVKILNIISQIISKAIPLDPKLCILHVSPLNFKITKHERLLLILCLLEVKRVIALEKRRKSRRVLMDKGDDLTSCLRKDYLLFEKQARYLLVHLDSVL